MPVLEWIGKDKVINHHLDVPYRVLDRKYSYDIDGQQEEDNGSENMIIHGDNLVALKSLLPRYEGKVDCIYIDPPYNTGEEQWVFNDNVNDPRIKKWLGEVVGKEGEDLSRHDKWLCMMYPRLKLLQRILSDSGVIFISIGEDEHSSLRLICDEIFGARNYITEFGRQMKSGGAKGHYYTPSLDYVLTYAKNVSSLPYFRALMTQKQIDIFYKYTEEEGPRKGEIYGEERLFKSSLEARSNQRYYIKCPDGSFAIPPGKTMPEVLEDGAAVTPLKTDKVWKWIYPRYKQELDAGNIIFKRTDTSGLVDENGNQCKWNIYNKLWLNEQQEKGVVPSNLIAGYENRQSAAELKDLQLGFNYAKPVGLVQYLLTISRLNKNAVILDSFAGSGTTAHAVLEMNKEDGGSRKFILIETEDYADSITAERVKRTIVGYKKDVKNVLYNQEITAKNLKNGADYIKEAKEISKESKTDGGYSKVSQPKLKDGYLTVVGTKKDADFEKGLGGDFSYYELGEPLLTDGNLNESVGIDKIREYVYYMDTKAQPVPVDPEEQYLLGVHYGTAYYFYYDKDSVTTLNRESLHMVKKKADSYVIYADLCMLSDSELEKFHITFKKIPRDISKL